MIGFGGSGMTSIAVGWHDSGRKTRNLLRIQPWNTEYSAELA